MAGDVQGEEAEQQGSVTEQRSRAKVEVGAGAGVGSWRPEAELRAVAGGAELGCDGGRRKRRRCSRVDAAG